MDIGIDLTEISRIEKLYTKDKFKNRVFNASEVEYIESKKIGHKLLQEFLRLKKLFLSL